jgi:hypothetical protein
VSTEPARRYVELSNRHDLAGIGEMLAADATYESPRVGTYAGRDAILGMMREFFARFPDVRWEAGEFVEEPGRWIRFGYTMRATDTESGERFESRGVERIRVSADGRIEHVAVGVGGAPRGPDDPA